MRTYFLTAIFACCFLTAAFAQQSDQNPRAQQAYEAYKDQPNTDLADTDHAATMGATIDNTYEAYDPIQIKEERRQERRNFRRQLRLERARRPIIANPRPWGWRNGWW